jgi:23S rRNA pseudouridine1911/1915/1917 synthase
MSVRLMTEPSSPAPEPTISRRVGPEEEGLRVDAYLARQPEVGSRSAARELLDDGRVTLDGAAVRPATGLRQGQVVAFVPLVERDPLEALGSATLESCGVGILHEDAHILVLAKPKGVSAHPPESKRDVGPTIAYLALRHCGWLPELSGEDRAGIVHRLDKDTSGVMLVAKTEQAFHALQGQFKARSVRKEYRAICFGDSRFDSDHVGKAIAHHPTAPDRMVVVREGGREAETYYEVVERFAGFTHFRCLPKTGRTHQIRVHMMSVGHSLVGDRIYRARGQVHLALPPEAPDPGRQCLHALAITLEHPRTLERLTFSAPMPEDMERLLRWLRENLPAG